MTEVIKKLVFLIDAEGEHRAYKTTVESFTNDAQETRETTPRDDFLPAADALALAAQLLGGE